MNMLPAPVMITGGSGLLGSHLIELFNDRFPQHLYAFPTILTPSHEILDITSEDMVQEYFLKFGMDGKKCYAPSLLIHCAALTGLEKCDTYKDIAYHINVMGTRNLLRVCKQYGIFMIYISTDYVFDGTHESGYSENDIPNPLSYYAKTKWGGELLVESYGQRIIRTSFCKEPWPHEFAYADKYTSADTISIISQYVFEVCLRYSEWEGILHVGTAKKTFYDLAHRSKPNVKEGTYKMYRDDIPQYTHFTLDKLERFLDKLERLYKNESK